MIANKVQLINLFVEQGMEMLGVRSSVPLFIFKLKIIKVNNY